MSIQLLGGGVTDSRDRTVLIPLACRVTAHREHAVVCLHMHTKFNPGHCRSEGTMLHSKSVSGVGSCFEMGAPPELIDSFHC